MGEAMAWALLAASSLVIGAVIAFAVEIPRRVLGLIMGFGAGVLISAVAYELILEAVEVSADRFSVAIGFAAGALAFYAGDVAIDRRTAGTGGASGLALVLGAVLDGIPESVVIGISLLSGEGASMAVIVAVFLSNVPEAISATSDLVAAGWSRSRVLGMWGLVVLASGLAAGLGFVALEGASGSLVAAIQAFAAGSILTMLADAMIPEAFEFTEHNKSVGLMLALGFAVSAALSFTT